MNTAWADEGDPQLRFVEVEEVVQFFRALNFESRAVRSCLDAMLRSGLCLSYDPTAKGIKETTKLEIAPAGRLHFEWALRDWIYLESMAEVTPLLESDACDAVKACLVEGRPEQRRKAIKTFVQYLLDEDQRYCIVPNHAVYNRQATIAEELRRMVRRCDVPASGDGSPRYVRHLGRIKTWIVDKGYGFIRQELNLHDAFAHIIAS